MARGALVNAFAGDYRLVEFLGAGGMGEVYRAVHRKLGRTVAIKVLSSEELGAGFVERFWNEARLHASLHHPNIAELYDFLELHGQPCIVMEYVDGEALSDRIRSCGRLPIAQALPVFKAVTSAAAYVHEEGIVHRDIKAANVRISSRGVAKLLDFGIAKGGSTPHLTKAGSVIGTLTYLAPEQLRGAGATPRSDVWALGVLFYEMVTGRPPFEAQTVGELLDKINSATFHRPSSLVSDLPPRESGVLRRADRIITRCLRREPSERYGSAGELLNDLEPLTTGSARAASSGPLQSVAAAPATGTLLGVIERYWAVFVAAAVVVLVLVTSMFLIRPAPPPPPEAQAPGEAPAASLTSHRIDVAEGVAEVYIDGVRKGPTPYDYQARSKETIRLELKQDGFATVQETFDITERKVWTFAMKRLDQAR
jgi:hypothetical protein